MNYFIVFFLALSSCSNTSNSCKGMDEGQFNMITDVGTFKIERKGGWQLESSEDYGIVYLNKTEYTEDCKYVVTRYKVIETGIIPTPDMTTRGLVEIKNIEENKYYFESSVIGTDQSLSGVMVKTSKSISEKFNQIINEQ